VRDLSGFSSALTITPQKAGKKKPDPAQGLIGYEHSKKCKGRFDARTACLKEQ
jgi:hypothetical protein